MRFTPFRCSENQNYYSFRSGSIKSIHKTKRSIREYKKAMEGTFKFGKSTKAKEKLTRLQFLQWLDNYIRPRKSKNNISESDNFDSEEESIFLITIMLKKMMFPRRKEKNTLKSRSKKTNLRKNKPKMQRIQKI